MKDDKGKNEKEPVFEERLVKPDRVRVWEDSFKKLCISIDGQEFHDLIPRRVFPLTGKCDYVSFMNRDGHETVMLEHPHKLEKKSRHILDEALEKMYFAAVITRVESITEAMGVGKWQVETDRGWAAFEVVDSRTIRKLPGGRVVITDADGNRFEISNLGELDARSQKIVLSEI